jgi:hypothetical protein
LCPAEDGGYPFHVEFGASIEAVDPVLFLLDIRQLRVAEAADPPVAQYDINERRETLV